MDITMITRDEWGALPPKEAIPPFPTPGLHVILTLKTAFKECTTREECTKQVQAMQKLHMEEWGLPDIAYNFILGHDGNVYEGRGWNYKPAKAIGHANFESRTYDIGVIGDYSEEIPDPVYYRSTSLLKYGVQFGYVDDEYTYVGDTDEYKERKRQVRERKKLLKQNKKLKKTNADELK